MTTPVEYSGSRKPPAAPSAAPQHPSPRTNGAHVKGTSVEAIQVSRRPIKYPITMKVNLSPAMAESMKRIYLEWGLPEGIAGRMAISKFLSEHDPNYRNNG